VGLVFGVWLLGCIEGIISGCPVMSRGFFQNLNILIGAKVSGYRDK